MLAPALVRLWLHVDATSAKPGTGNWVEDVSEILHPNSIIHGIDINGKMFPTVRPLNTSFAVASVLQLPAAWTNRFDFVHQRFLVWALSTEEWMQGLHEAFRVLHPGGWLQIVEPGSFQGGGEHTHRMGSMMQEVLAFRGLRRDIADAAPRFFEEIGFEGVEANCFRANLGSWAGDIGTTASGTLRAAFRSLKPLVLRLGGLGMKSPEIEFDELLERLEREWDESGGAYVEVRVIYGRKPPSTV